MSRPSKAQPVEQIKSVRHFPAQKFKSCAPFSSVGFSFCAHSI
jgi:hypothetical protein